MTFSKYTDSKNTYSDSESDSGSVDGSVLSEESEEEEPQEDDDEPVVLGGSNENDTDDDEAIEIPDDINSDNEDAETEPRNKIDINDINYDTDDDDDEDYNENYLQKFDADIHNNYIVENHPECLMHNYDEIEIFTTIVRNENNIIVDELHKTIPFLTKYEKTRILGQRAKQINNGSRPLVNVPDNVIDGYIIAELELQQKRIPFIIRRPLPNGGMEYWNVKDLENISY
jgi:DNA-directed RNA polymerase I, II, and III subunit RPABC2